MTMTFADLPSYPAIETLKARAQWVAWKYDYRNGPDQKPTKPPISPKSGFGASHSNPSHWGTYEQAAEMARRRNLAGVGYVLTGEDGIGGFDLDRCRNDTTGEIDAWAKEILDYGETYAEVSPSGEGIRIFALGKPSKGQKVDAAGVEIYAQQRYLTVTGHHIEGTPTEIRAAPRTIAALEKRIAEFTEKGSPPGVPASIQIEKQTFGDDFFGRVNTAALASLALWVPMIFGSDAKHYPSTGGYRVSSRALGRDLQEDLSITPIGIVDFGVHDMGDARQGKRSPIDLVIEYGRAIDVKGAAFWLCDNLGRRPEDLGWSERAGNAAHGEIQAARLREEPDGTLIDAETREIVEMPAAEPVRATSIDYPLGLVGDIARWIVATSRKPQPALAIGSALTVIGAAAGRQFMGPTNAGTALYVLALAPTAQGKDIPLKQARRIFNAARLPMHLGPDEFMSFSSVVNLMKRQPLSLCPMDEFGDFMRRVYDRKGSVHARAIPKVLRSLWGANFDETATAEWADKPSITLQAPHLSIFGASTHEQFYYALEGGAVADGTLNRFLIIEGVRRPKEVDPQADPYIVPDAISDGVRRIYLRAGEYPALRRLDPTMNPAEQGGIVRLPWCPDGSKETFDAFRMEIEDQMFAEPLNVAFLGRSVELSIRIATIIAAGCERDSVRVEDVRYGIDLARQSAEMMIAGAADYMAENEQEANWQKVVRMVRDAGGRLKYRDIQRAMRGMRGRDLRDLLAGMCESEVLGTSEQPNKTGKGHPIVTYHLMQ